MAFQTFSGRVWLPERMVTNSGSPGLLNLTLNAANEIGGAVVKAPKTGNITHVLYTLLVVDVTSGPLNFDIRLETVDTTTGLPDTSGTLFNSGTSNDSNGTDSIATSDDQDTREVALTTSGGVAVTVGDPIAVVLTAPGSGTFDVQLASIGDDIPEDDPYGISGTTAVPAKAQRTPVIGFKYSDGSYWAPVTSWPYETAASPAVNTGTNPDEVGNKFTFPFPIRFNAVAILCDLAASTSFTLKVIDSGGSTLYSKVVDTDINFAQDDGSIVIPIADQEFDADEMFRVTCTPDGATSLEFWYFTVETAAYLDMFSGGQDVHACVRENAGTFDDSITARRYFISLGVCAFSDGAGGAGGGGPLIGGRLIG